MNKNLEERVDAKTTLIATGICLAGGIVAGLICKYGDVETSDDLKNTAFALTFGFITGSGYMSFIGKNLNQKVSLVKELALDYASLMTGMFGSYFL